jgi:myotubularin-related protein 9
VFLNPLYERNDAVLWPSLYPQSLSVWSGLFLRFQRKENPIREAKAELIKKVEANQLARERVEKLRW